MEGPPWQLTLGSLACAIGIVCLCSSLGGGDTPTASIPLPQSRVATPVSIVPTTPPIQNGHTFISTEHTPVSLSNWHHRTLMHWYIPQQEHYAGVSDDYAVR
jgi:hypothetical protein